LRASFFIAEVDEVDDNEVPAAKVPVLAWK
jgi:hypothetical protein